MNFTTDYLHGIYEDPVKYRKLVLATARKIRALKKKINFEAIAFTGTSGAAMAYPVSVATGIPLICVRKDAEGTHSNRLVEGSSNIDVTSYIIVDDFITTGTTIKTIISKIEDDSSWSSPNPPSCVGIVLYSSSICGVGGNYRIDIPIHHVKFKD